MPLRLKEGEVEQQLIDIKRTIQELQKIVCIAQRHASEEVASDIATPSSSQK